MSGGLKMLEVKTSKHLGVPFVEVEHEGEKKYLCFNGVLFKDSEYMDYADLQKEYERREKEDKLYDFAYAKSTGILRKKRNQTIEEKSGQLPERKLSDNTEWSASSLQQQQQISETEQKTVERNREETWNHNNKTEENERNYKGIFPIIILLGFTSVISMYISTLHTATYLFDYVDKISAWLMSASVTAYNSTAFEVSVLFKKRKRFGLTVIFITLWFMVTLFSMSTTVSVFYDRFNFTESVIAETNKETDSNKLALSVLKQKEEDLREAIAFKKKDIEYRQEREYATTAVRNELTKLQEDLQLNLSEQQKLLSDTPEITEKVIKRKESLFSFLGRLLHMEGGVLEFIMSTLSAIFINIISPMSLVAVAEIKTKENNNAR